MSDLAEGSKAALQLQQNMAAAPYVEQQASAVAEDTQLKLQQDRLKAAYAPQEFALKAKQDAASLERTKFANVVLGANIQLTDSKNKAVKALMAGEGWSTKSFSEKGTAIAAAWFDSDPAAASDLLKEINSFNTKDAQARATQNKADYETLAEVNAIVAGLPDDQIEGVLNGLPENSRKLIASKVGEENWKKTTPAQKKVIIKELFKGPAQQLTDEIKTYHDDVQKQIAVIRKEAVVYTANQATKRRGMGRGDGSANDRQEATNFKNLTTFDEKQQRLDDKENIPLQKEVDKADEARIASKKGFLWDSDTPTEASEVAYRTAVDKLNAKQRKQIERRLAVAKSAPDYDGKAEYMDFIKQELDLLPPPVKEEVDTPAKVDTTVAPPAKNVTSTKGNTGTKESPLPPPSDSSKLVDGMYYDLPGKGPTLYTKPKSNTTEPKPAPVSATSVVNTTKEAQANADKNLNERGKPLPTITEKMIQQEIKEISAMSNSKGLSKKAIREIAIDLLTKRQDKL